jgi:hypothetical protein
MQRLVRADAPRSSRIYHSRKGRPPGEAEAAQFVETPRFGLPLDSRRHSEDVALSNRPVMAAHATG